jgi:hypothetical protein
MLMVAGTVIVTRVTCTAPCVVAKHVDSGKVFRMSVKSDKVDKLPQPGAVCTNCQPYWRKRNLTPKYMVTVFDADGKPITTEIGIEIVVCPHCDGDYILNMNKTPEAE